MLYQEPKIEILKREIEDVVCASFDEVEVPGEW